MRAAELVLPCTVLVCLRSTNQLFACLVTMSTAAPEQAIAMTEVETSAPRAASTLPTGHTPKGALPQNSPAESPANCGDVNREADTRKRIKGDDQYDDDDNDDMDTKDVMCLLDQIPGTGQSGKVCRFAQKFVSRSH